MDDVLSGLGHFLVPILGEARSDGVPELKPLGSGTLIQIGDTRGILTAAHVWNKAKKFENIHFVITRGKSSAFAVPRDHIFVKKIWNAATPEWGPDLAFLEIAPNHISTIGARKSFLNLNLQKATLAEYPPKIEKGLWAITGLVAEFSEVQVQTEKQIVTVNAVCRAFFTLIQGTHEHQGYDYFDAGVKKELDGVPTSFGGVSGGGLWQIDLSKNKDGEISWDGKRYFRGVAFWQSDLSKARQVIRFHGPRSVFEKAWAEWGFPENI